MPRLMMSPKCLKSHASSHLHVASVRKPLPTVASAGNGKTERCLLVAANCGKCSIVHCRCWSLMTFLLKEVVPLNGQHSLLLLLINYLHLYM